MRWLLIQAFPNCQNDFKLCIHETDSYIKENIAILLSLPKSIYVHLKDIFELFWHTFLTCYCFLMMIPNFTILDKIIFVFIFDHFFDYPICNNMYGLLINLMKFYFVWNYNIWNLNILYFNSYQTSRRKMENVK